MKNIVTKIIGLWSLLVFGFLTLSASHAIPIRELDGLQSITFGNEQVEITLTHGLLGLIAVS